MADGRSLMAGLFCSVFLLLATASAQAAELKEAVEQLAVELTKSVPEGRTFHVAVVDFPDLEGVTSNLGRYIAERLTTRLSAQPRKFRVIERRRLNVILAELKFSMSDLVDPGKAKQLGKMLGVEAIVVGTVSDLGNVIDVDARIIEIETNNILPGVTAGISKDDTVRRMMQEGRTVGAASPQPSAPRPAHPQPKTVTTKDFTIELLSTEFAGNAIRFFFFYTSLSGRQRSEALRDANNIDHNYMIDNLGNRYKLVGDSEIVKRLTVPPNIRLKQWVSFEAPQVGASEVNVFLKLTSPVEFRNIPLPR